MHITPPPISANKPLFSLWDFFLSLCLFALLGSGLVYLEILLSPPPGCPSPNRTAHSSSAPPRFPLQICSHAPKQESSVSSLSSSLAYEHCKATSLAHSLAHLIYAIEFINYLITQWQHPHPKTEIIIIVFIKQLLCALHCGFSYVNTYNFILRKLIYHY